MIARAAAAVLVVLALVLSASLAVGLSGHPDHVASFEAAVERGLIEGEASYYWSGEASSLEYAHAVLVAVLEMDDRLEEAESQWRSGTTTSIPSEVPTSSTTTTAAPSVTTTTSTTVTSSSTTVPPATTSTTQPTSGDLVVLSGVHTAFSVEAVDDTHYFCEEGTVLDGGGVEEFAFYGSADNVTVEGCEIRNYVNPAQWGAIDVRGGNRWVIIDNEIHHNWGVGVYVSGVGHYVGGNRIHHQHQLGVAADGVDIVIEANEIAYNNWLGEFNWGWEAGGTKFWATDGLVVRGNFSHHNDGPGLWDDYNNVNFLYEDNVVEDNLGPGIFHEIGYGGVIRNNEVRRNGDGQVWLWDAGIQIAASSDTEVYGNVVEGNSNGITLVQQERSEPGTVWVTVDNVVYGNVIRDSGLSGAVTDNGYDLIFERNEFYGNVYEGDVGWSWGGEVSWAEWVAIHPGDAT